MSEEYRSRQQRKKNSKTTKRNNTNTGIWKKIFFFFIALGLLAGIAGGITVLAYISSAPDLDPAKLQDPLSSKVFDMNGKMVADLGVEKRTELSYNEIPEMVRNSFIAVEDVRFEEHFGIDPRRIIGAAVANVTNGFGTQGGSTITQQVVKNSFLSPEKSLKRKVQEAWLAIQLERKLSKEQILEIYLNKIYFSKGAYGVAKAAETYFGKTVDELTLAEAALLAGMPQSPNNYNPFTNPEAAEKRRNTVLTLMEKHGFASADEVAAAKSIPVGEMLVNEQTESSEYDAFIDHVIDEVQQLGDMDMGSAGLEIYTTLDTNAQSFVETVLNTDKYIDYPNEAFQAGIVLVDTNSGAIRAIGGGRNRVARGLNFATDIRPQPGSVIKPILDYAPAIEHLNWSTYHQIKDEQHSYSDGTPIKNWDNEYWGQMSIRRALEWSRNIPALKTMQEVGLSQSKEFGEKLGLNLNDQIYESYSIGGFNGTSPLEIAGAYSAFGNGGIYNKPYSVTKVVFPDNRVIELKPEPVVAMSDHTAFMITDMLKTVVQSGTGVGANVPGFQLAGKTGTTNFDQETKDKFNIGSGGVRDIWFAGYTPEYTLSVWTGYEKTTSEHYIRRSQTNIAKQLFKTIMQEVGTEESRKSFTQPSSVVRVGIEKGSNPAKLPSEFTPEEDIVYEYFIRGTEPTEVSDQYQQIEKPVDVILEYDQALDRILIRWAYNPELKVDISFVITQSIKGQTPFTEVARTKEEFFMIDNPEKGVTYAFELYAISDNNENNKSDPVAMEINIPAIEENENELPEGSEPLVPEEENDGESENITDPIEDLIENGMN